MPTFFFAEHECVTSLFTTENFTRKHNLMPRFQVPKRQREGHAGSEERPEQEPGTVSQGFSPWISVINLEQESHIVSCECFFFDQNL
jgi:hypothetical protein